MTGTAHGPLTGTAHGALTGTAHGPLTGIVASAVVHGKIGCGLTAGSRRGRAVVP